jgi:serine O-acetyltransferase
MNMNELIIPEKKDVERAVKSLYNFLFPRVHSIKKKDNDLCINCQEEQFAAILSLLTDDGDKVSKKFFKNIDALKEELIKDAQFILESDPAATQLMEVIAIYPGFFAIFSYRVAHAIALLKVPLLPRMITEYAHKVTGIDIHPLARIGHPFSIDHGTGIVIGETTIIGKNVKLYQGVTLGALSVDKSKASKKRHPTIEDNVILYAGCTILGGETVIGRNSVIGGNTWLTESIAPFSVVYHKSEIIVRNHSNYKEPINFII